jgi:CheY-like chemotaxis protein
MNNEFVMKSRVETTRDGRSSRRVIDSTPCGCQPGCHVSPRHILCVDDDVVGTRLFGRILELAGYSVVLKHCPFEALQCNFASFDLAVFDFHMPGMNGRELLLRAIALGAKCPIILRSGSTSFLSHEDRTLFSRCVDKGESILTLLGIIATFLDPNGIPDFGSDQIRACPRNLQGT